MLGPKKRSDQRSEAPAKLDAKLGHLTAALSRRITELVTKAKPLAIEPNRVLQYAVLLVMTEREAETEAVSKEHTERSWHELAGLIQGLDTGYREVQEAGTRYRRGRRARNDLGASLDGVITKFRNFQQLLESQRADLPVHNEGMLSPRTLEGIRKTLEKLRISLVLEDDVLAKKRRAPSLSTTEKTYALWWFVVPRYRGKWSDMHSLATAWRLSDAKDVETFRSMVKRLPRSGQDTLTVMGSAWRPFFEKR